MYYIVYIFEMAGLSGNQNLIAASIQYIIVSVAVSYNSYCALTTLNAVERGDDNPCAPLHG